MKSIASSAAMVALRSVVKKAEDLDIAVSVAILDRFGHAVATVHMDGAFLPSRGIARDKAYTAVGFRLPSARWEDLLPKGSSIRESIMHQPGMAFFGGGLPIEIGGEVIGSIGVSGGSESQDESCAKAGIDAISNAVGA